ncbi:MAG: DUF2752 domain-containing protein [Clostridia bacterium]|nr:DUF2752 domain-containing protein [Clostridia bacterium]
MNRVKNITVLIILIIFLLSVAEIPVTCVFYSFTGIFCPACGMTRAFKAILHFDFLEAFHQNILSIPLFLFLIFFILTLCHEIWRNQFELIPKLLRFFEKHYGMILLLLFLSFVINNLK